MTDSYFTSVSGYLNVGNTIQIKDRKELLIMISLNEYIKKYSLKNKVLIEEKIRQNYIFYSKHINGEYYIDEKIWKIDFRRIPKKKTSLNIKASIIRAINNLSHLDHKMLGIEKSHFVEYLDLLKEQKFIRLVNNEDKNRIENYIIGNVIPKEILSNRRKLLALLSEIIIVSIKSFI